MEKDILADFTPEDTKIESDEDIFDNLKEKSEEQDDSPAESPDEKEQADDTPSQEGEEGSKKDVDPEENPDEEIIPFHKHPRWKEKQQEIDDLKAKIDSLEQKTSENLQAPQKQEDELPAEWVALYGDDELSRKAFMADQKRTLKLKEEILQEFKKAQEEERRKSEEETSKWEKWVDDELTQLKESGEKFEKNKLLKIAFDYKPTDESGNISFPKALEIMRLLEGGDTKAQPKKQIQKDIASKTLSDNRGETKVQTKPSVNTLRNRSFQSLIDEE